MYVDFGFPLTHYYIAYCYCHLFKAMIWGSLWDSQAQLRQSMALYWAWCSFIILLMHVAKNIFNCELVRSSMCSLWIISKPLALCLQIQWLEVCTIPEPLIITIMDMEPWSRLSSDTNCFVLGKKFQQDGKHSSKQAAHLECEFFGNTK